MRIKALEDWDYIPEFAGNRDLDETEQTVYRFRVLSGKQELELRKAGKDVFPDSMTPCVVKVLNPPVMVDKTGKEKVLTVDDISDKPELKGLFMELIIEYSRHASLDGSSEKH